jgi:hypothetical protein
MKVLVAAPLHRKRRRLMNLRVREAHSPKGCGRKCIDLLGASAFFGSSARDYVGGVPEVTARETPIRRRGRKRIDSRLSLYPRPLPTPLSLLRWINIGVALCKSRTRCVCSALLSVSREARAPGHCRGSNRPNSRSNPPLAAIRHRVHPPRTPVPGRPVPLRVLYSERISL